MAKQPHKSAQAAKRKDDFWWQLEQIHEENRHRRAELAKRKERTRRFVEKRLKKNGVVSEDDILRAEAAHYDSSTSLPTLTYWLRRCFGLHAAPPKGSGRWQRR